MSLGKYFFLTEIISYYYLIYFVIEKVQKLFLIPQSTPSNKVFVYNTTTNEHFNLHFTVHRSKNWLEKKKNKNTHSQKEVGAIQTLLCIWFYGSISMGIEIVF